MESPDVALMATSGFEERNPVVDRFNAQFAHLNGSVGRLGGLVLAGKNGERNSAAIYSGHVLLQQGGQGTVAVRGK
jgi:hypothetical protein